MLSSLIQHLVSRYQNRAGQRAAAGKRPYMGPCEKKRGGHCSVIFARDLRATGIVAATKNYLYACPRGIGVAGRGLAFATTLAVIPQFRWDPNDEPCFEGSPAECP